MNGPASAQARVWDAPDPAAFAAVACRAPGLVSRSDRADRGRVRSFRGRLSGPARRLLPVSECRLYLDPQAVEDGPRLAGQGGRRRRAEGDLRVEVAVARR